RASALAAVAGPPRPVGAGGPAGPPPYGDRGARPPYRAGGARPPRGDRPERPPYRSGDRPERPPYRGGDRPERPPYRAGDRPEGGWGDRAPRPAPPPEDPPPAAASDAAPPPSPPGPPTSAEEVAMGREPSRVTGHESRVEGQGATGATSVTVELHTAPPDSRPVTRDPRPVFSLRAVLLAFALIPLNSLWIVHTEIVQYAGHPTTTSL